MLVLLATEDGPYQALYITQITQKWYNKSFLRIFDYRRPSIPDEEGQ